MKIAFYKKKLGGVNGAYAKLVRWWDAGPYSHCELVFDNGISASSSMMDAGVRFKEIEYNKDSWDTLDVPEYFSQDYAHIWFCNHESEPYDVLGNLGFVFKRGLESKSKWFCSESVAAGLRFNEPWRLSPNGLYQIIRSLNSSNQS